MNLSHILRLYRLAGLQAKVTSIYLDFKFVCEWHLILWMIPVQIRDNFRHYCWLVACTLKVGLDLSRWVLTRRFGTLFVFADSVITKLKKDWLVYRAKASFSLRIPCFVERLSKLYGLRFGGLAAHTLNFIWGVAKIRVWLLNLPILFVFLLWSFDFLDVI